jgi:diguanylate cyclase (GGDEF)-like protein
LHAVEKSAIANNRTNKNHSLLCHHIQSPEPESSLCMPLVAQGEALGVLHIRHTSQNVELDENGLVTPPAEWFTEVKQQLIHTVADSLALALANLKLRETLRQQSIRDPLTGLFNRRYLEESLEREVRRAARSQRSLGVIMMDIDHFKHFNDTFGHDAGDTLLRELGVFLRSQVRGEDIACRYGGEEFAIVMPDTTLEVIHQRAEKLREGIKHLNVMSRGKMLGSVSISAGVATFPEHGGTGEAVIRTADAALFKAKQAGRDRVTVAPGLP